ncbi:MAG: SDR family oxidoreductase [Myxococcota bacterium]
MSSTATSAPTALVTGGAVRVGRAIVEALLEDGYRVWIHCHRSVAEAEALAAASAGVAGVLVADLRDDEARASVATGVGARLDLLVNSAASYEHGAFEARSDADLRRVLDLNLVAPVSLIRSCLPALRAANGAVVNILDLGALHPWAGYLDHCLAKSALKTATEALALELAPLRINAVAPGTVSWPADGRAGEGTEAGARVLAKIPRGRIGTAQDVAEAVRFLARAPHVSGHTLTVDGGATAGIAGTHG